MSLTKVLEILIGLAAVALGALLLAAICGGGLIAGACVGVVLGWLYGRRQARRQAPGQVIDAGAPSAGDGR